jgi:hypothetical protein
MPEDQPTVFVLGAGFTKAFLPNAPLLTDDYNGDELADKFRGFQYAARILELERSANQNGYINLERLMTRLDGGMPYDGELGSKDEGRLLLAELKRAFEKRLMRAKEDRLHDADLLALATHCLAKNITCITFNYDDVFDEALFRAGQSRSRIVEGFPGDTIPYWHPDGGYGFFCRPSESVIRHRQYFMDVLATFLLKLHGSVNWRPKRGYSQPYAVEAIVHEEPWFTSPPLNEFDRYRVSLHVEADSFIVPPVLMKSSLVEQPILRLLWSLARQTLERAQRVVFVGYSLPITDLAAAYLFRESIGAECQIEVVNYVSTERERSNLLEAYRRVFPRITETEFDFGGALEWSRRTAPDFR